MERREPSPVRLFEPESFTPSALPRLGRGVFASAPAEAGAALSLDPKRLLVRFREGVSAERIDEVVRANGGRVQSAIAAQDVTIVAIPAGVGIKEMLTRFAEDPEIEFVEPNLRLGIGALSNDPFFPGGVMPEDLWGLHNTGQSQGTADADVDAPEGWDLAGVALGSPWPSGGFAVGVVDSGVDATHPDLAGRVVAECSSALTGTGTLVPGCDDDHGHGTHVTGTIAAVGNNGIGIVGVAPNAHVFMCKALAADGGGWTSDIAACINEIVAKRTLYAISVISLSLGGGGSSTLESAINRATSQGMLVVAAAGNDGTSVLRYPAGYAGVVSVAATDRRDVRASFSNANPKVEVSAPGVGIVSTVPPAIVAGGYGSWSGTSMATPHAAAIAALINRKTGKVGQQLRDALDGATDDIGPPGRDDGTGFGRVNLCKALGGCGVVAPTPSPTALATPSPSPTVSPAATPTRSPAPTASPTPVPVRKGKLTGTGYVGRSEATGVTVSYVGPVSGSVSTRAGRRYSVDLPPGSYDVRAGYRGVSCRAGSRTGPTSTKVEIVSGATKTVNWYC